MFDLTANPWTVLATDFPATGTLTEQLLFLLNYAVLAPSEYNTQPWLFKVTGRTVDLYVDRSRRLPVVDPHDREMTISCGAAFLNLRIAIRHFGYTDEVDTHINHDNLDLLASIRLGQRRKATRQEQRLFHEILHRRTNRHSFESQAVPASLLSTFQDIAEQQGAWFHVLQEEARHAVADLIATGDRMQWADRRFRRELASWVRSEGLESRDGLPGYAYSRGNFAASISPFVVRTFDMGNGEAAKDHQLVAGSPVLAVLGTPADTPSDWFSAGQVVEQILLYACAEGVRVSLVNQPIEIATLRASLRDIVERNGFPQLVLRMGYGEEVPPTPRRSVREVLL